MAILDRACARRLAVIRPGRKNAVQPNRKTSVAKHERSLLPTPNSEEALFNPDNFAHYINMLLNYLDTIAIGIQENFYEEKRAKLFLRSILTKHCDKYLDEAIISAIGLELEDFNTLAGLHQKWKAD